MPKTKAVAVSAQEALEIGEHVQQHIRLASGYYPDLMITRDVGKVTFASSHIHDSVNQVDFIEEAQSGDWKVWWAIPYREVDVGCDCHGEIAIHTKPYKYLIFIKQKAYWSHSSYENIILTPPFEEVMKKDNISKYVIGQCRLKVLEILKTEDLKAYESVTIANSIKRILPFT